MGARAISSVSSVGVVSVYCRLDAVEVSVLTGQATSAVSDIHGNEVKALY